MKKSKRESVSTKYETNFKPLWVGYHTLLALELAVVIVLLAIIAAK